MRSVPIQHLDLAAEGFVSTRDGVVTSWNLAAAAIYGWQPHEALGLPLNRLFGAYGDDVGRRMAATGSWEGLIVRSRRDGANVTSRVKLALVEQEDQRPEWLEVSTAVDARHPAERELAETWHLYRNLFGAVAASFWKLESSGVLRILTELQSQGVDDMALHLRAHPEVARAMMREMRVVDVNDRTLELFGPASKREIMAMPIDHWWPDASTQAYIEGVLASISGQTRYVTETRMRTIDGSEFDAVFTGSFFNGSSLPGTVGGTTLLVGFTDISDRVRATHQLANATARQQMIMDVPMIALSEMVAPELAATFARLREEGVADLATHIDRDPAFVADARAMIRFGNVNAAAVRLNGASSRDDLVGRSLVGIVPPASEAFKRLLEAIYACEPLFQAELRVTTLEGKTVDTLFCCVVDAAEDPPRVLIAQIDISEQARDRDEAHRMLRQFAHASRISLLGQLSASIVHEISQPITAILNHATAIEHLARRGAASDQLLPVAGRIAQQATRAAQIIQSFRALAADKNMPKLPISLEGLLAETRALLQSELAENDVRVTQARSDTYVHVVGDRVQLQQVLANLMMNAIQAMESTPRTNRHLSLEVRQQGGMVLTRIEDSGPGLSEDFLRCAFQSFRTTKADGIGIGLTICRSIAEAHGGSIEAGNRSDGHGAVFTLALPATSDE